MKNSLLVDTLRALDAAERRRLKKWVRSPAHNQRQDCTDLLEYLLENDRLDKPHLLDKERLFSRLFPGESYDDAKLRQTLHFLTKAIESFLIHEEVHDSPISSRILLLRAYRKRKLEKPFRKTYRQTSDLLDRCTHQNEDFLDHRYATMLEHYIQYGQQKRTKEFKNLQEISDSLDHRFIAEKLRQSCMMQSHQIVIRTGYDAGLQDEVLRYVEKRKLLHIPAIAMYYYIHKALNERESEPWFEKLMQEIDESSHLFPKEEMADIYKLTINYCIRRINAGQRHFLQITFDLYQRGLRDLTFLEEGQLSTITFNNVFRNAMLLQKLDWAHSFIEGYARYLPEKKRQSIVSFTRARLLFEEKQYEKAMAMLLHADFDDTHLLLNSRTLLLKMYYELEEFDALESLLESMRVYLKRKDLLTYHRSNFQNVIKYTKKLVHLSPYDKEKRRKLRLEIAETTHLHEKEWLLEQVDSL